MSMMLTARRRTDTPPGPDPEPEFVTETGVPYPIPRFQPYNVPDYNVTPTPDGTGSALHPDVIDFGPAGWNGWRYWMGYTPYYQGNDAEENPCIGVSNDGFTWQAPAGLTNPLDPTPAQGWNADTDLVYANGTLHLFWRDWDLTRGHMMMRTTTDGVNWTPKVNCLTGTQGDNLTSPAVVFDGTTWHMWNQSTNAARHIFYRTATNPAGPWSSPVPITMNGTFVPWHLDVIRHEGRFWMVIYIQFGDSPLRAASSVNGVNWTAGEPFITRTTGWQGTNLYRGTIQPMPENDTHFRLWYSASGTASNRIGYTHMRKAEFPPPPA